MKILDEIKNLVKGQDLRDFTFMLDRQEMEKTGSEEIIRASVKKYRKQYIIVLLLISFFEIALIIRGLAFFDLTKIRRVLYLVSYVLLLSFSLACLVSMILSYKKNEITHSHIRLVYIYCIFLTIWSAGISILDILGGHTPIVFLTVVVGTGALAFLRPIIYICLVTPLSGFILWFASLYGDSTVSNSGYPINFLVFIVFTFFIVSRQYKQNKQDYVVMKKLEQLSYHDQLTGLKNRYALHQVLDNFGDVFYFGMFDFDNFKKINDAYGHDFGDGALCEVAHLLEENFHGFAFRYGGDEFVVISTERKGEIMQRCQQINADLREKYPNVSVQLSGGFYMPKNKGETYEDFLKYSDRALYQSKEQGKGRFIFYEEE